MKPLYKLTLPEKAQLIYELFPAEIPPFIGFSEILISRLIEHPNEIVKGWRNRIIPFKLCEKMATQAKARIDEYRNISEKNDEHFTATFFQDQTAVVFIYCFHQYKKISPDKKFRIAVDLFFSYR